MGFAKLSFPISEWPTIIFLSVPNILLFVLCASGYFPAYSETQQINANIVEFLRLVNILFSIFLMAGSILLAEYASSKIDLKIETMSTTHSLTNMLNRRGFMLRFEQEKARCTRSKTYGSLLLIDVNNCKLLNDRYGHEVGDNLLRQVAQVLEKSQRETDIVARFSGDEFVALIAYIDADKEAAASRTTDIAKKINLLLADECSLASEANHSPVTFEYECSASIGITPFNGDSELQE
ncbi:MAG: diguanylate cyclase (GGDEF)-like protein, partial [Oceanicoccus sp.]